MSLPHIPRYFPAEIGTLNRSFTTHDNGGRPYRVDVDLADGNKHGKVTVTRIDIEHPEKTLEVTADEVFIGRDIRPANDPDPDLVVTSSGYLMRGSDGYREALREINADTSDGVRHDHDGNTVLLRVGDKYFYIADGIHRFEARHRIIGYASRIGNNDVPYPYALDINGYCYILGFGDGLVLHSSQLRDIEFPQLPDCLGDMTGYRDITGLYIGDRQFHWYFHADMAEHYDRMTYGGPVSVIQNGKRRLIEKGEYVAILQQYAKEHGIGWVNIVEVSPRFM